MDNDRYFNDHQKNLKWAKEHYLDPEYKKNQHESDMSIHFMHLADAITHAIEVDELEIPGVVKAFNDLQEAYRKNLDG